LCINGTLRQKSRFQAALNIQQQENLRSAIQAADKERKRIAEDLHDTMGSLLSATKLKLSVIEETGILPRQEKENMKEVLILLDEAMQEMKNIAYNIMPATLSKLGLTAALQNLFNRISGRLVIHIDYTTYGFTGRLDETTELSIYQVVLEAINNIVKHSRARNVTVQLVRYTHHINITIEDDGQGFEVKRENTAGNGLNNMQSRVKNLNGIIDIDSRLGSGTTIIIEVPYT
jgi:signal transduction histidine kinase